MNHGTMISYTPTNVDACREKSHTHTYTHINVACTLTNMYDCLNTHKGAQLT